MSYAVHSFQIFLYGGVALFILYVSLRSTLSLPAIERFEGLRSHHEVHVGSQQPGAIEKSAHADHSFNYLENIPNFRNLPTYSDLLSKRDVCSDTFPGTVRNTCTPGNTLCCVSLTKSFPQCQVILNSGYCCVSSTGSCYIDLTTSACGTTGAVKCTELTAGTTSEICCPAGTTCPNNFNQSLADVRCEIPYPSASSISSSSTSTSSSSTTSSITSSSTSSTTSGQAPSLVSLTVTSATSSNTAVTSTHSSTLPAGAIAGIAVGAVAILILAALIFLLLKNRKNKARASAAAGPHTGTPYATTPGAPYGHDPYKQGEQYPRQAGEMDAVEQVRRMGELDAIASDPHLSRHELDGSVPPR